MLCGVNYLALSPLTAPDRGIRERCCGRQREDDNKEGEKSKCEVLVVFSAVDEYDLECIVEDATWGVAFSVTPLIGIDNLLSLVIIQIHCDFICLYLFWVVF